MSFIILLLTWINTRNVSRSKRTRAPSQKEGGWVCIPQMMLMMMLVVEESEWESNFKGGCLDSSADGDGPLLQRGNSSRWYLSGAQSGVVRVK